MSSQGLIRSLVGLRGVLAPVVVVGHLLPLGGALLPASVPVWRAVEEHAQVVIDMFFVLSGFVIATGYRRAFARWPGWPAYGRFLWARLSRFYPVHLCVLGALVMAVVIADLFGAVLPHRGSVGWDLARHITLVNGWGGLDGLTWNGPSWSVSAEWLCYVLLPLLLPWTLRLTSTAAAVSTYAAVCGLVLVVYAFVGFDNETMTYVAPLPRALGGFLAGAALQQLVAIGAPLARLVGRGTTTLGVLAVGCLIALAQWGAPSLFALPLFGLVVLGLSQQHGRLDRLLATRPLVVAGEVSVALYLTHVPTLFAVALVVTPQRFPGMWAWLGLVLAVAAVVLVTWFAFVAVERPLQRAMRRMVGPPSRPSSPATVGSAPSTGSVAGA